MNILVLCTGNSARSVLTEVLLNELGNSGIKAFSAGSKPAGQVNPYAINLLKAKGHSIDDLRSKSWDEFATPDAPKMDIVITVCGNAASEVCPVWPGAPIKVHWGFDDPAYIEDPVEAKQAFEDTYDAIKIRISNFLLLPLDRLNAKELQAAMQDLAK